MYRKQQLKGAIKNIWVICNICNIISLTPPLFNNVHVLIQEGERHVC